MYQLLALMYVLAGRMGYCLTLLFGVPLILLPCREAWTSLPSQLRDWRVDQALIAEYEQRNQSDDHFVVNGVDFDESYSFFRKSSSFAFRNGNQTSSSSDEEEDNEFALRSLPKARSVLTEFPEGSLHSVQESEGDESGALLTRQQPVVHEGDNPADENQGTCECDHNDKLAHWAATLAILSMAYVTAISVPGVATVWSIFGSSMALFIAFVVPTACYLEIHKHKGLTGKAFFAWVLLILSLGAMVLCTYQAVSNAINGT